MPEPANEPEQGSSQSWLSMIARFAFIYMAINYFSSMVTNHQSSRAPPDGESRKHLSATFAPKWKFGLTEMSLSVYVVDTADPWQGLVLLSC